MNYTICSGSHEEQGRRDTMEDTHVHLDVVCCEGNAPFKKVSFFGVYDGHGGVRYTLLVVVTPSENNC